MIKRIQCWANLLWNSASWVQKNQANSIQPLKLICHPILVKCRLGDPEPHLIPIPPPLIAPGLG